MPIELTMPAIDHENARPHAIIRLAIACVALSSGAACLHAPPPSQFPAASDALARMKQTFECANGVFGEASVEQRSPTQGRIRGSGASFAVNPARFRTDIIGPMGGMAYTWTSNGVIFQALDFRTSEMREGPAKACNLGDVRVPLPRDHPEHAQRKRGAAHSPAFASFRSTATTRSEERV